MKGPTVKLHSERTTEARPEMLYIQYHDADRIYRTHVHGGWISLAAGSREEALEQFFGEVMKPLGFEVTVLGDPKSDLQTRELLIEDAMIQYLKNQQFVPELIELVESGPIEERGDRFDFLLYTGMAVRIVHQGGTDWVAATEKAVDAYCRKYKTDNLVKAIAIRRRLAANTPT